MLKLEEIIKELKMKKLFGKRSHFIGCVRDFIEVPTLTRSEMLSKTVTLENHGHVNFCEPFNDREGKN